MGEDQRCATQAPGSLRGDNGGENAGVLVLSSGSGLDIAGELGAVLGPGFEVSLVRAANRQTVELVLDGAVQFGIVHILAHGSTSVLDFGDERMSEAELVSLISAQKALQFVVLACCNGYETAGGIHNALHVPVVAYNAPIEDRAAVEFARGFYRSWRRDRNVGQAVDRGREALAVLFPSEAPEGATAQRGHGDAVRVRRLHGED